MWLLCQLGRTDRLRQLERLREAELPPDLAWQVQVFWEAETAADRPP
jgi:hypothetical protein